MLKFITILMLAICSLVLSASLAQAQVTQPAGTGVGPAGQDMLDFLRQAAEKGGLTASNSPDADVYTIIAGIINTILSLVGIIFFVYMFYAGFRWMTAEGAEEVIKESKSTIKSAIVGIIIIFSAFVLSNFVLNRLEAINRGTTTSASSPTGGTTPAPATTPGSTGPTTGQTATGACRVPGNDGVEQCTVTTEANCSSTGFWIQGEQC